MSNQLTRVHHQGTNRGINSMDIQYKRVRNNERAFPKHSCSQKQTQTSNQHSSHRRPTTQRARSVCSWRCRGTGTGSRHGGAGRTRRRTSLGAHGTRCCQDTRRDRARSDVRRSNNDTARSGSGSLRHRCAAIRSRAGSALTGAEDRVGVVAATCA